MLLRRRLVSKVRTLRQPVTQFSSKKEDEVSDEFIYEKNARRLENLEAVDFIEDFIAKWDASRKYKIRVSDEELVERARIAKEYSRQCMIRHNRWNKDIAEKIWFQQYAVKKIPQEYLAACLKIDNSVPPPNRPYPSRDEIPLFELGDVEKYLGYNDY